MSTLTLELERLHIAALEAEAEAEANGYPPGWLKLFGSIDDDTFVAPARTATKPAVMLDDA
jgi:hypothetical protein